MFSEENQAGDSIKESGGKKEGIGKEGQKKK